MAIDLRGRAYGVEIVAGNGSEIDITIQQLELADCVSAGEILDEYGARQLLDAIGGFDDWVEEGSIKESEVAEWLEARGYKVEKE